MTHTIQAVDLFAGAGGTSTGLAKACRSLQWQVELTAINHWPTAVETHKLNHPWAKHLCVPIEAVDPRVVVPGGVIDLLAASPECTHFSNARGGRPTNDQLRASSWNILRWLELLDVRSMLIENVPEYRNWGPVLPNGRPDKTRKGETFNAFLDAIRSFGYSAEYRVLNAADYGEATARRRLFVICRKDGEPVEWPVQTHSKPDKDGKPSVPGTELWRSAREVLDLSLPNESIFGRKRPLSPKTLAKIIVGARKFWGIDLEMLKDAAPDGDFKPFLISAGGPDVGPRSADEPMNTVLTRDHMAVVDPLVLTTDRPETNRSLAKSSDDPLPTVTGNPRIGVVEPFIIANFGEAPGQEPRARGVEDPLPTVTSRGAGNLIEPFIMPVDGPGGNGTNNKPKSIDDPLPTIRASRGGGHVVEPVLIEYYGNGKVRPVTDPVPAVTTHDRFGLAIPLTDGRYLDIRFRMLQPPELAAAMGFDPDYDFTGTKTQVVKQIGNAVGVNMAKALCEAIIVQTQAAT